MASDNTASSNNPHRPNFVQVKIEPETTSTFSAPSTSSAQLSNNVISVKMEPGLPTTTQRLTSFRIPRDLTLGGNIIKTEKPKKVYVPNVNVQRNRKTESSSSLITMKTDPLKSRHSDRGRERGREDRGRGKEDKDKGNVIQSVGIWSEGIHTERVVRKNEGFRTSSSTASATKYQEKSKLNINKTFNKIEDEKKLKNLLRDDFIDDSPDDDKMYPLTLPRGRNGTIKKNDTIDNDQTDEKPIISEDGKIINVKKKESKPDGKKELTISELIENKANSYTLIQFPESLPGLRSSRERTESKQPNDSNIHSESDSKAKTEHCTLNNLNSGLLGKLEILKSGKARLRLGDTSFFVDVGAEQCFQQDLLAVKIDAASQTGDLINLGAVSNKLICSPDIESMLESS